MTPVALAEVSMTPVSMQIENRKLPKKDCRNRLRPCGARPASGRVQGSITIAARPKRSQASRNTGKTAVSGLLKAT